MMSYKPDPIDEQKVREFIENLPAGRPLDDSIIDWSTGEPYYPHEPNKP